MKQQKREFNEFQTAYLKAKTIVEVIRDQKKAHNEQNPAYQAAKNKLKNRKNLSEEEFNNVIELMSNIEVDTDKKFDNSEARQILRQAEFILIDNFKKIVLSSSFYNIDKHGQIREMFENEQLEKIRMNIVFWQKLIDIAMKYTWGELIPNY